MLAKGLPSVISTATIALVAVALALGPGCGASAPDLPARRTSTGPQEEDRATADGHDRSGRAGPEAKSSGDDVEVLESWETIDPLSPASVRLRARYREVIRAMEEAAGRPASPADASAEGIEGYLGRAPGPTVGDRLKNASRVALLEARARFKQGDRDRAIRLVRASLIFSRRVAAAHGFHAALACASAHSGAAKLLGAWLPTMDESQLAVTIEAFANLGPPPDPVAILRQESAWWRLRLPRELEAFFSNIAKEEMRFHAIRKRTVEKVRELFGFGDVPAEELERAHAQRLADLEHLVTSAPLAAWPELEEAMAKRVIRAWRPELEPFFPQVFRQGGLDREVDPPIYQPDVLIRRMLRTVDARPGLASVRLRRPLAILLARLDPAFSSLTLAAAVVAIEGYPVLVRAAAQRLAGRRPEALRDLRSLGLKWAVEELEDGFTIRTLPPPFVLKLVVRASGS